MSIIEIMRNEIMVLNDKFMTEAEDNYNFWEEHIKYVVQEALALAEKYNADTEIVELAALLHDIALIAKIGTRKDHHINGAKLAEAMLSKHNYPKEKIDRVKKCVLNHRSSKNGADTEDICISDADILAHFDNVPMLFNTIMNDVWSDKGEKNTTLPELRNKMRKVFEYDYNDLSERTKLHFRDRYELICRVVLGL